VKQLWMAALVLEMGIATAEVPQILIEACSMLEPASRRIECLQVANQQPQGQTGTNRPAPTHAPSYLAAPAAAIPVAPARSNGYSAGTSTCHVGPRGGTYTITKSGKKNYGGC
jgi:hypothetical protein